ncbi:hypothetical protein [Lentzea sp. NPDC051838]|uniref:hypothetical protein n=1 Tax=Lentzea sp. NPDC051838 TaxID=3154849 RepID=UPI00343A582A
MRYFVFPAEEPEPRCPLAVVRVGDDGTEEAFTRDLRWEPSSTRLRQTFRRDSFEVDADWADVFMIDIIEQMRRIRYGDPDWHFSWGTRGVWGARQSLPDIDLGDGEAQLARRAPEPFRWFVPDNGIVLRVAEDGTAHRFTLELRWEPSDVPGSGLEEVDEDTAMVRVAEVVERIRESWQRHWPGRAYFAIFKQHRHVTDLANAQYVVRADGGADSQLGESFSLLSDWRPTQTLREFAVGSDFGEVKIPIAEPEAEHLVEVIRGRRAQWKRAYGN